MKCGNCGEVAKPSGKFKVFCWNCNHYTCRPRRITYKGVELERVVSEGERFGAHYIYQRVDCPGKIWWTRATDAIREGVLRKREADVTAQNARAKAPEGIA